MRTIEMYGNANETIAHVQATINALMDDIVQAWGNVTILEKEKRDGMSKRYRELQALSAVDMVWATLGHLERFCGDGTEDSKITVNFRPDGEVVGYGNGRTMGAIFRHVNAEYTYHT